jgi:hypothetical protein
VSSLGSSVKDYWDGISAKVTSTRRNFPQKALGVNLLTVNPSLECNRWPNV